MGHSHIDAAWLWPLEETLEVCIETFQSVLEAMERHRELIYAQSSAQYYAWMEEHHPELLEEIRRRVAEGRWEVVGGMWVEADCNIPSGESLVRQILHGKRYLRRMVGCDVEVAWLIDSFGFPATLPQILSKAGLRYFITQKLRWNDSTAFPHNIFRWRSPEGSEVLAYQTPGGYHETLEQERIEEQLGVLRRRHRLVELLLLIGEGDHGGGIPEETLERADRLLREGEATYTRAVDYLRSLEGRGGWPLHVGELYLQYHRGVYTSQVEVKRLNRRCEVFLEMAEKLSTMAMLLGGRYPVERLEGLWRLLLLNQFHDIISGTTIEEVYERAVRDLEAVEGGAREIIAEALGFIAGEIEGDGDTLLVFNTLSWRRDGLVEAAIPEDVESPVVVDHEGRRLPTQRAGPRLLFVARGVPPLGYKAYRVMEGAESPSSGLEVRVEEGRIVLENEHLEVHIDEGSGHVVYAYDKGNGRAFIDGEANVLEVYVDEPRWGRRCLEAGYDAALFDAWEVYIYQQPEGVQREEPRCLGVRVREGGPVRAVVEAEYLYRQEGRPDSRFWVETLLLEGLPLLLFRVKADWHGWHRLVKVSLPLSLEAEYTVYEAPYGCVPRRNPYSPRATLEERAKYEVPGQRWLDHSDGEYGVTLLNDGRYGFDASGSVVRMTLLRIPTYPSLKAFRMIARGESPPSEPMDQGLHEVSYALHPHRGDYGEGPSARWGYEFNHPLLPHRGAGGGPLPAEFSLLSAEPENVILTVAKRAEEGGDVVLRLYEASGRRCEAEVHLFRPPERCRETDLLEEGGRPVAVDGCLLRLKLRPHEIKTLRLSLPPGHQP